MLEKHLGVLLFILGSLGKDIGDLLETLFARGAGEEAIAVPRLRFTGKSGQQVFLGLGASE